MAVWVSSDWHCDPEKLKQTVVDWIGQGKKGNHRLVGAGDLFDILPWGKEKWRNAAAIEELARALDGYPFDYVAGNHDPYNIMERLVAPYHNISLLKELSFNHEGRQYFVIHGHQWAIDWGFLGLRRVAPYIVEFMVDHAPGPWYSFCRSRGWLASSPSPGAPAAIEKERITSLTRLIWSGGTNHALKRDCCVVLGHTHTTGRMEHGACKTADFQAYMVDDGNLPDGTYVEITDDGRLKFLA